MNIRRRKILLPLLLLLLCTVPGCGKKEAAVPSNEIRIAIDIDVPAPVYAVGIDYALEDEVIGSTQTVNADGSEIRGTVFFMLEKRDFPVGAALDAFSFAASLSFDKDDGAEVTWYETNECEAFHPMFANSYRYVIKGDTAGGFILSPAA